MADAIGRRGLRQAARALGRAAEDAAGQIARRDALFDVFVEELRHLTEANGEQLLGQRDALQMYERFRASLTPAERDEFLRTLLGGVQGLADDGRRRLRTIIKRHVQLIASTGREEP